MERQKGGYELWSPPLTIGGRKGGTRCLEEEIRRVSTGMEVESAVRMSQEENPCFLCVTTTNCGVSCERGAWW